MEDEIKKRIKELEKKVQELEKSNFLYKKIFEKLPFGIQIFDSIGYSYNLNTKQKELLGLANLDEGIGKFNVLNDPYSKSIGVDKIYKKVYKGEEFNHEFEYNLGMEENKWKTRKDTRIFSEKIVPIKNEKGEVIYVIAILDDKTLENKSKAELIKSKERFDLAMHATNDGIWDWNLITNEIYFSPSWKKMIGFEDNELENKFSIWEEFTHPDDVKRSWEILNEHLTRKIDRFDVEFRMKHKNGHWVDIRSRAHAYFNDQGKAYRVVGTHVDITEQKKIEEELRELNATKDKFFSIIAHDLRSPFNAILGFSEIALEEARKQKLEKIENYCNHIYSATKNSFNLLNNLLEWSRLQTGKIKFNPEEVNLLEIVNNILSLTTANIKEKQLQIEHNFDKNIYVYADKYMLETILRNLISNAEKYSNKRGIISIVFEQKQSNSIIQVIDQGVGIKKENLNKILDIEGNINTPGTLNEKGTGLGLILCKEFIEKHNGKIWVESELNKGSIFSILLPNK